MNQQNISFWRLLLLAMLVNILAQAIHEGGHWTVYQANGRGPVWGFIGLVQLWETTPQEPALWVATTSPGGEQGWLRLASPADGAMEELITAAAGPLASLVGVVVGLALALGKGSFLEQRPSLRTIGLMLALVISLAMTLYYLRSPMRSGGDEADMAVAAGIPKLVFDLLFGLAFVAGLAWSLKLLPGGRSRAKWAGAAFLGSVPTGILLVLADGVVRSQVDLDHSLFQPVLGFSLPVLLVYLLTLAGLWFWQRA